MAVNASFNRLEVLIGGQDWSKAVVSFEVGDSERDDSGLITTRGKLVLAWIREAPDTMNTRSVQGRNLWFKGQTVIVNVLNGAGTTWYRHPRGYLYIAKPPLPPTPENPEMEIELADVLQFRTYPQPKGNVANPTYQYQNLYGWQTPTSVNPIQRNAAIISSLQKAGITNNFVGSVGQYPVGYPLNNNSDDGYVQFAGKVAYGGIEALFQKNDGAIDSLNIGLAPGTPIATVELGKDELLWENTEGGETPVESVIVQGNLTGLQAANQGNPNSTSTTIDYGPGSMVNPALGNQQIVIRQTIRTEYANSQYKNSTVTVYACLGLISQTAWPQNTALGLESQSVTEHFYDLGNGGKLSRIVQTERSLFPKACGEAFSAMSDVNKNTFRNLQIISKYTQTTFEYDPITSVVKRTIAYTQEPQAAIATDESFVQPANLVPSEQVVTTYKENRKGDWTQIIITDQSLVRVQPNVVINTTDANLRASIKLTLTRKSYEESSSNTGQTTPPAAERSPSQFEQFDLPIQGVATFNAPRGPFNERERTWNLDVGCVSVAQLQELAQIKGAELFGRAQGARIQLPLRDEFLTNPRPLRFLAVIEPELLPTTWRKNLTLYQIDGIQFTHAEGQAVVTCNLIWIGTQVGTAVSY